MAKFKPVDPKIDFVEMEKRLLKEWYSSGLVEKYLHKNDKSQKQFSFLDGPITANNPMGVHHAWGRTYKDLWQRFFAMKGYKERFQNGFDCQGLWVEVEVEKDLGFKSKKEIETYGVANFVNKCKERVLKYSAIQTEQSKRLGYFADWEHSYFTMSDENNYAIWNFLKVCWAKDWIYKGHESIPWCPRCETAISQHEILTEDYKELVHESIIMEFPIMDCEREYLLVWTTTPWTIPANVAVAVDEKAEYSLVEGSSDSQDKFWVATPLINSIFDGKPGKILKIVKGKELVGLKYKSAFDGLPVVEKARQESPDLFHTVVATDNMLMPISMEEGTGMVHTAVSAGEEDFKLGKKLKLPMIPIIADNADYFEGLGEFSGKNAKKHPEVILDYLREREEKEKCWVFKVFAYKHRYPACWRCKTELVWKVADEWYVAMDKTDESGKTLREQMVAVTKKIHWLPEFGLDRELDWLKNMHDWLISKKNRYWGLALPIYECQKCGNFEVVGSKEELKKRATIGWDKFDGNTPHKPWIDEVKIKCSRCGGSVSRILDVGNPWLDAGIVSISTMPSNFFPADFITESFPGQFKNWFYSLIVMGTVLKKTNPFKTVLGFALACGSDGQIMHKSNPKTYISFDEGADKAGSDTMRWIFTKQSPSQNLLFDYKLTDETRRRYFLTLWNVYSFFVTYANLNDWEKTSVSSKDVLDWWIESRLDEVVSIVTGGLERFDAQIGALAIEGFVSDLSLWYIRRSRDRMTPEFFSTCHEVLVTLCKLIAPFTPFIAEEMYQNLTGKESVHLEEWPHFAPVETGASRDKPSTLIAQMELVRKICEFGHAQRKVNNLKVRQPLHKLIVRSLARPGEFVEEKLIQLIKDELNVKEVEFVKADGELTVELDIKLTPELEAEGKARDIIRDIQDARKAAGCELSEIVELALPDWPKEWEDYIKKETLTKNIKSGETLSVIRSGV